VSLCIVDWPHFCVRLAEGKGHRFKSFRFLLTDTTVPRDTKSLVAGVSARKAKEPEVIEPLLAAIQDVSDEVRRCLTDTDMSRSDQISVLESLIDSNHSYLVQLGVSHPSLEAVRAKTASEPFKLHTKLTGAGGGGCAYTLVPDGQFARSLLLWSSGLTFGVLRLLFLGFPEDRLERLKESLHADGFVCYETFIGGSGLGVAVPEATPAAGAGAEKTIGSTPDDDVVVIRGRKLFENTASSQLHDWAEEAATWAYV
jgi:hypothetical protein